MLKEIKLKIGSKLSKEIFQIPVQGITIFVGTHNAGKSLVLKEIREFFTNNNDLKNFKILQDCEISTFTEPEIEEMLNLVEDKSSKDVSEGHVKIGTHSPTGFDGGQVHKTSILNIANKQQYKRNFCNSLLQYFLINLDGRSRFSLIEDRPSEDLLNTPKNLLQKLFVDKTSLSKVRENVKEAFGLYFVIDPTALQFLRIRLSKTPPESEQLEQGLDEKSRAFQAQAQYIKDYSDGTQAYTGIMCGVLSKEYRAILIDEPEAFLSQSLAQLLGKQLSLISSRNTGNLIASTHDADFLLGCIQSGASINIIRLEYDIHSETSKAKKIDGDLLKKLISHPLMKSSNVLSSLFYDGVIVTESDNDRVFYYEVYDRLKTVYPNLPHILFLNAQNKQTIPEIINPLREFGIPAAAIVDIDVIKDSGKPWTRWLNALKIPSEKEMDFRDRRQALASLFDEKNLNMKDGGINLLEEKDKNLACELFNNFFEYGGFIVQNGELEQWLPELNVRGKKDWVIEILKKMDALNLTPPINSDKTNDVWNFILNIAKWIKNSDRKGL